LFQAPDCSTLYALPLLLVKIVLPEIVIRSVAREQVVAKGENRMTDGEDGPFAASSGRNVSGYLAAVCQAFSAHRPPDPFACPINLLLIWHFARSRPPELPRLGSHKFDMSIFVH